MMVSLAFPDLWHYAAMAAVVFGAVLGWPLFTGSLLGLYLLTLAVTVPLAWLLHRLTNSWLPARTAFPR